jgi:hypothetical protein
MAIPNSKTIVFLGYWVCSIALLALSAQGCKDTMPRKVISMATGRTFHDKFQWKANEFFDDVQVIALCKAIESNDLKTMKHLINAGANVNARGKGNMTPLMWAFPDNKLERFKLLLDHGADPNVQFTSNLGITHAFMVNDSVTSLSATTRFPGYFEAVMEAGGDPALQNGFKEPVLHAIIKAPIADSYDRCELAIRNGAKLDTICAGLTPPMAAVANGKYDLALRLIEMGSRVDIYHEDELQRIIHLVLRKERDLARLPPEYSVSHKKLLVCLVALGEDELAAREDLRRWAAFSRIPAEHQRQWQGEVAERKKRELENESR